MIKKAFYPESFDMDVDPVALIGQYSRGLDKTAMDKRASAFTADDLQFERKPGYQYLHIITTGGMEKYGANANNDAFPFDYMEFTFAEPKKGTSKVATLDGGLKKYHNKTYMSGDAAVYQEHQTKRQGKEPSGYIVKAATNDNMWRGELIVGLDEKKCYRALNKKASGGNMYFSMGCDCEKDVCSHCHNEAHTREEYCEHIKNHLGKIASDGRRICMINDAPKFYDISIVARPADKIAFALSSLGGLSKGASMHSIAPTFGVMPKSAKVAAAMKLAKLEKEVPVEVTDDLEDACCDEKAEDSLMDRLKNYSAADVLDALNRKGIMLGPKAFYRLIASDEDDPKAITDITDDIKIDPEQIFYDLDHEDCPFCSELDDASYDMEQIPDMGLLNAIEPFLSMLSSDVPAVKDRVIRMVIIKKASHDRRILKEASDYVSRDYARYAASFVARNPDKSVFALTKIRAYSK